MATVDNVWGRMFAAPSARVQEPMGRESSPVPASREKWNVGSESAILCIDSDILARSCLVFGSTAWETMDTGPS